jgi:hypothetical protein
MRSVLVSLAVVTSCVASKTHVCERGTEFERTCAAESACDDVHHLCVGEVERAACAGKSEGDDCTVGTSVVTDGVCDQGVCFAKRCGDSYITGDEVCEGEDLGGAVDCTSLGYYEASPLTCNAACAYDTSQCLGFCGDGLVTADHEQCDGANLGGAVDCQSIGYYEPSPLSCTLGCAFDESQCLGYCGDGIVTQGHELCDGAPPDETCASLGFVAGFLDCKFCAPDLAACKFQGWHESFTLPRTMLDIDGSSDTDIYAVGTSGTVLRYDGATWSAVDVSSCIAPVKPSTLTKVDVIGPGELWAGGIEAGKTVLIHVTGASCTKMFVDVGGGPLTQTMNDLSAPNAGDVWAIVGTGLYHYASGAWTQMSTGLLNKTVWASGPTDAYAASISAVMHWDGFGWTAVTLPTTTYPIEIYDLYGTSPTDVWVGGDTTHGYALAHHFDGAWTSTMPVDVFDGRIVSMSEHDGTLFAAARNGPVYVYDGESWAPISASGFIQDARVYATPSGEAHAVDAMAPRAEHFAGTTRLDTVSNAGNAPRAFALSSGAVYAFDNTELWIWDGITWSTETRPQSIIAVWADASGTLFTLETGVGLMKRTGANTYVAVDATATGYRMWGSSTTDIWIVHTGTSLLHWTGSPASTCPTCTSAQNVADMWGAGPSAVYSVGNAGEIRHYNGSAWSAQASGTTVNLAAVWGWADNDVVAVGAGTVLHQDGTGWTSLGYPQQHDLIDVWGTSVTDLFVASSDGLLYHYDGTHWSPVRTNARPRLSAIVGSGDSLFWFGGSPPVASQLIRTTDW